MTTALPGTQWIPSNGCEGESFIAANCCQCARDKPCSEGKDYDLCSDSEVCPILAASFRGEAVEWRRLDDGTLTCTGFVDARYPAPPRCTRTADMFEAAP